jgi:hypothetical protein
MPKTDVFKNFPLFSDEFKNKKDVALKAMEHCGRNYLELPENSPLLNDRDIMLEAVSNYYGLIKELPEYIQKDVSFFKEVSTKSGYEPAMIPHIPEFIQNDKDFALWFLMENVDAFDYFSDKIKNNKDIINKIIDKAPDDVYKACNEHIKKDENIAKAAVLFSKHASIYQFLPMELRKNKDIALLAVSKNADNLDYVSSDLSLDKDIVLKAVYKNPYIINGIATHLQKDETILKTGLKNNPLALFMGLSNSLPNKTDLQNISEIQMVIKHNETLKSILNEESDRFFAKALKRLDKRDLSTLKKEPDFFDFHPESLYFEDVIEGILDSLTEPMKSENIKQLSKIFNNQFMVKSLMKRATKKDINHVTRQNLNKKEIKKKRKLSF